MSVTKPSSLNALLEYVTRLVTRFPVLTLAIAIVVAVASLTLAGSRLKFRTSRLDLINPNSSYNRLWLQYVQEFGDEDDVVVVVEGVNRESVIPVLDTLFMKLAGQDQFFHDVLHKIDFTKIRSKGLHYLPVEELKQIGAFVNDARPILLGDWSNLKLSRMTDGMCMGMQNIPATFSTLGQSAAEARLSCWLQGLASALESPGRYESPWPGTPGATTILNKLDTQYLLANNGRLGFVLLRLKGKSEESLAQNTDGLNALRSSISEVHAQYPHVKIGITGLPVMENDEMASSQVSMTQSTALSLVGVIVVFVVGFGGLRHPLLAIITLLLGMAWSFGYITLVIGHLNILSIAFGAVVIGLGIDFGIHYVARYLQLRNTTVSIKNALVQTAIGVGPGMITGAVTTAVAFFVAGFTEFTGVAELGVIAGGGILLCCVAAMTVLPAMIYLSDRNRDNQVLPTLLDMGSQLKWLGILPVVVLVIGLSTVIIIGAGHPQLWYDHNLLNLQPEGM
jgi:predicted RND superfamily exporter protein